MIEIERNFAVADVNKIDLRIALGDLTLTAGSGDLISLRARLRSDDETELESTVAGGVLTIKNRTENGWLMRNGSRIDVALAVPPQASLAVAAKTGLGDVNADGVAGLAEVHTGKGDVRAVGGSSSLTIKTGKGDVLVRTWRGDLDVTTGKGDVLVSDLAGGLHMTTGAGDTTVERWQAPPSAGNQVKTGSGDVAISQAQAGSLELSTGRGDSSLRQVVVRTLRVQSGAGNVAVAGDPLDGQWDVRSARGDLTLALPAAAAARVEATTRHGNLRSNLPQVKVARPGPASQFGGRSILVIGEEPRAEIRLDTVKGDISVEADGAPAPAAPVAVQEHRVVVQVEGPQSAGLEPYTAPAAASEADSSQVTALGVLESLARGEISVDEAETLLRALER